MLVLLQRNTTELDNRFSLMYTPKRAFSIYFTLMICLARIFHQFQFLQVLWSRISTVAAHLILGSLLLRKAQATNLDDSKQIYNCYMYVWKLFYAEYLLIPLLR